MSPGWFPSATAPANGHAVTVTFDDSYRQLTARSATRLVASQIEHGVANAYFWHRRAL